MKNKFFLTAVLVAMAINTQFLYAHDVDMGKVSSVKVVKSTDSLKDLKGSKTSNNPKKSDDLNDLKEERKKIEGIVLDSSKQPIVGATINWKGTMQGTTADLDGHFSLAVNNKVSQLVVSCLGYKTQTIDIKNSQKAVIVILEDDSQMLDEMIVVGYGLQKKSSLTGAVEKVDSEDLLMMPTANLDEALTGQVAGLQVMHTSGDPVTAKQAEMHIRGIKGEPLLVIDGVPRFGTSSGDGEARLSDLNPDDISEISILKDAAASAVYGARAANGVILVQTKRAKHNDKVRVNYRGQMNLQQSAMYPEFLDSYRFAQMFNQAVENTKNCKFDPFTEEELIAIKDNTRPNIFGNENYFDYLDKYGYTTTHSLSVAGGSKNVRYYLSTGYTHSKGIYSKVGRDRINYMAKVDVDLTENLVLSVDLSGNSNKSTTSSFTALNSAYSTSPLDVFRYTNGLLSNMGGAGNPLVSLEGLGGYMKHQTYMNTLNLKFNYEMPFLEGLSAYFRFNYDNNHQIRKEISNPVALYTYDEESDEYAVDDRTIYPKAKSTMRQEDGFFNNKLYEVGLNYNNTFASYHDVTGLLVANYQRINNQSMVGEVLDKTLLPEIIGTVNGAGSNLSGTETILERASLIGRATYGYRNKYFAEFNFRIDGSTSFHPDNRWGFFPSVSASWVLSNEDFFKSWEQDVLSNVKFRLSTGKLGNDGAIEAFSYQRIYNETTTGGYNFGDTYLPGLELLGVPNKRLSWGKTRDYNAGVDLGFWDGRLGISAEYYTRYDRDMITMAPSYLYPSSTGALGTKPNMNFAELKAWGWDLTLIHKNTINKFRYNISLTLAKNRDKYTDYGDESNELENLRRKGKSSRVHTVYEDAGLFQNQEEIDNWPLNQDGNRTPNSSIAPGDIKYVDQNGDGKLTKADLIMVRSSSRPDMDLSIRLGMQYKGFFMNANFQGSLGYAKYMEDSYCLYDGSLQKFQEYHVTDTWTPDNPNARFPRVKFVGKKDNNLKDSTFWIRDCDFIRLRSLNIGYSLPSKLVEKLKMSSMRISLQGGNLFTITNLKGLDPETEIGYPIQRSYGMSLSVGF